MPLPAFLALSPNIFHLGYPDHTFIINELLERSEDSLTPAKDRKKDSTGTRSQTPPTAQGNWKGDIINLCQTFGADEAA